MKTLILYAALMTCAVTAPGLGSDTDKPQDCYETELVKSWVESDPSLLEGVSFAEKSVYRRGDSIAIGIVRGFSTDELLDPDRLQRILSILHLAFSRPRSLTHPQDRNPAITNLLLAFLKEREPDEKLQKVIVDTQEYISAQVGPKTSRP